MQKVSESSLGHRKAVELLDKLAQVFGFSAMMIGGYYEDGLWLELFGEPGSINMDLGVSKHGGYGKILVEDFEDGVEAICEILGDSEEGKLAILLPSGCPLRDATPEEESKLAQWVVEANLAGYGTTARECQHDN